MLSSRHAPVLAFLVGMAAAPAVFAAAGAPTVVLGFESLEGAPDSLANQVTDALRQRVASSREFRLLQGKDLAEIKLVFACPDELPACMAQAGKSLGATQMIFGNVRKGGSDYEVSLKLLDVASGSLESFQTNPLPRARANAAAIRQLAPVWLARLSGRGNGSVQVTANFPGAAVSIDGNRVGVTGADPVIVGDIAPGKHDVAVEKDGYTTTRQDFTLSAGQSLPLALILNPVSVEVRRPSGDATGEAPGSPPEGSSHALARTGFVVGVVGALASAGLAIKYGLDVRDINQQLNPYRRVACAGSTTGFCDGNGAKNVDPTLSDQERAVVNSKTDDGHRDETLQWVFVGVGGAFAIAGGYLLYKGYLASDGHGDTKSAANHGLRIFPAATASAGGVVAEFDF
jgi:PEGA domain-containing protein